MRKVGIFAGILNLSLLLPVTACETARAASGDSGFRQQPAVNVEAEIANLTAALSSGDEEERRNAVRMLSALENPAAAPALLTASNDRSEIVRASALTGLALLKDTAHTSIFAARLAGDKSPFVQKAAAYALGRLQTHEGTVALVAALEDKKLRQSKYLEVRSAIIVALAEYADAYAIAPLTRALADKSEFIRAHAARGLGANGRAAAQAAAQLAGLLITDEEQLVKRQAAIALGLIGERSALPALERAARDADPYLSLAALEAIRLIQARTDP